jgi:hypothetical protein
MSRVGFVSACFAAALLMLSRQEAMAQGELAIEPRPFDSLMSPHPLGPLQKFGDLPPGGHAGFSGPRQAAAPHPRQANAARNGQFQAQRRQNLISAPRQTAFASSTRHHEWPRGTAGSGSVLSLAPRYGERLPSRQPCFPSSTIHIQQNEACIVRAPTYKGRFEELLGE